MQIPKESPHLFLKNLFADMEVLSKLLLTMDPKSRPQLKNSLGATAFGISRSLHTIRKPMVLSNVDTSQSEKHLSSHVAIIFQIGQITFITPSLLIESLLGKRQVSLPTTSSTVQTPFFHLTSLKLPTSSLALKTTFLQRISLPYEFVNLPNSLKT